MNPPNRLPAGVLATVLVVSALMLLSVLGVLALWESDFLFFSRAGYLSRQRANVESAFVLYAADSTLTARLDEQGGLLVAVILVAMYLPMFRLGGTMG